MVSVQPNAVFCDSPLYGRKSDPRPAREVSIVKRHMPSKCVGYCCECRSGARSLVLAARLHPPDAKSDLVDIRSPTRASVNKRCLRQRDA